jgi:hypothetical protein
VADALAPIADKLKRCLRLLSSDSDGEVIAAVRALNRTLKSAKLDIHAIADCIGQANGKEYTEAQLLKARELGIAEGRRREREEQGAQGAPVFRNVNPDADPTWHEIAVECAAHPNRLHDGREKQFVNDMVRRTVHGGEPTEKQASWLRKIYARVRR